jgi:hypothetical protein
MAPNEKIEMSVDNHIRFNLHSEGKWAWLKSSIDEGRFTLVAQKGNWLRLSGKDTHDKPFKETYSLGGFTAAYKAIFNECSKYMDKKKQIIVKPKTTQQKNNAVKTKKES